MEAKAGITESRNCGKPELLKARIAESPTKQPLVAASALKKIIWSKI